MCNIEQFVDYTTGRELHPAREDEPYDILFYILIITCVEKFATI